MEPPGSVTRMIPGLRSPDPAARDAAARLVLARYLDRLLGLARGQLDRRVGRREDEEDVLQSAFRSFCRRQGRGDFELEGRDALWALLVTITLRKAKNTANRHRCAARDYRRERDAAPGEGAEGPGRAPEQLEASDPTPAEAAALAEEFERRMRSLADPLLRRIALRKLEGYTNAEVAAEIAGEEGACSERRVERKLAKIREKWAEGEDDAP